MSSPYRDPILINSIPFSSKNCGLNKNTFHVGTVKSEIHWLARTVRIEIQDFFKLKTIQKREIQIRWLSGSIKSILDHSKVRRRKQRHGYILLKRPQQLRQYQVLISTQAWTGSKVGKILTAVEIGVL